MNRNVIYTKEDNGIVKIVINRPEARNALNQQTRLELKDIVQEIDNDSTIRVAVITGAGEKAFISGADINEFKDATPIIIEERATTTGQALFTSIENLKIPVIAMIQGFCLGSGLELAMCCDIRVASTAAKLGQPEINIGIFPGGGGTQRLPRLVGWGRAKELIYTGRIIDAAEAERIGLVDKVVAPEKLEEEVQKLSETIAGRSAIAIKLAKKSINRGIYTDLAAGLDYEKTSFALCFATEDHNEGIAAFLEKRKPEFKGR